MKKIIRVTSEILTLTMKPYKEMQIERITDKEGNIYIRSINDEKWVVRPPIDQPYKTGHGLSIEEAYCHMKRSFDIPAKLTD